MFRIDYTHEEIKNVENSKNIEYSLIDIEETISDFVQSIDIDHKNEVISYISEIYNKISK